MGAGLQLQLNSELQQRCQSGTDTAMKPRSSSSTFFTLELPETGGFLDPCAPLVPSPHLGHIFGAPARRCCAYKHLNHGNCESNWTFSLAVDGGGGGGVSEASLVFGGDEEQVEGGGRGFWVGGGLVV